ncbi:sensor histidine kinase [Paenibacillus xanthanilyticus]|uniref:histidine kinase n=1 Tax=Paenibacillus xanthanilyticus TaxID=1783531 RepID=A0ABV8K4U9_9BACL
MEGRPIRRICLILFILALIQTLVSGCAAEPAVTRPVAKEGVIDLRNWSFLDQGSLNLSGEWALFDHRLLGPVESAYQPESAVAYAAVPQSWNSYPASFGLQSGQGYATYRLKVLLTPSDRLLAIRVPNIFSAYKLWVDGRMLASEGEVGRSRADSDARQQPRIITLDGDRSELQLTVQVSNFQHRKGGIWVDLRMGTNDAITKSQMRTTIQEMTILGSLVIIGLFHLGLYAFRRQERFTLYFGLLCLFVAARTSVTGNMYLIQMFPGINWEAAMKIEYISFAFSAATGILYIGGLFPREMHRRVGPVVIGIGMAIGVFVLATPAIVYSKTVGAIQLFVVLGSLYILLVLWRALFRKREGAGFILVGVAVFVATILNDILFYNEMLVRTQLVPIGLFFFMLMQSFIISSRFSNALRGVEQASAELRELNMYLEERIAERTEELRSANESLACSNRELARSEASRRQLMTNISHDLRTPITLLQGYLEAMRDGVVNTEEQQNRYVRMMLGKVMGLSRLIQDLFELTRLESGQLRMHYTEVTMESWMGSLREQYEMDVRTRGISFECRFEEVAETDEEGKTVHPDRITLRLDQQRMERVMANLIYNAVKYTAPSGKITLSFSFRQTANEAVVKVTDTGEGIEATHLPFIFDRFYKKDAARNSADGGSGLGLAIAKEIVEAHNGTIGAESEPGVGTTIWLSLPVTDW